MNLPDTKQQCFELEFDFPFFVSECFRCFGRNVLLLLAVTSKQEGQ